MQKRFLVLVFIGMMVAQVGFSQVNFIDVTGPRSGICITPEEGKYYNCTYGGYINAQSVEWTGGSGADIKWCKLIVKEVHKSKGYEATPYGVGTTQGTTVVEQKIVETTCRRSTIGSEQYGQNRISYNPFRGQFPVRLKVYPHNYAWQTNFTIRSVY